MIENSAILRFVLPPADESRSVEAWGEESTADTTDLLQEALRLGVFPAVYRRLQASGGAPAGEPWERCFRDNSVRNLGLEKREAELVGRLREEGIRCVPVKGVSLARTLYPDLSWRQIADIDLLVSPADVPRSYECLKERGLRDPGHTWTTDALERVVNRPAFFFPELQLLDKHDLLVELHWDWPGPELPSKNPVEDREAYLVYLCRHAGKHYWSSLRWAADIELYLRRFGEHLQWQRFWRLAGAARAEWSCAASLYLTEQLFGRVLRPEEEALACRAGSELAVLLPRRRRRVLRRLARSFPSAAWRRRFARAAELSSRQWRLLVRGWLTLIEVRLAVRFRSFSQVLAWATLVAKRPPPSGEHLERTLSDTVWMVDCAAGNHLVAMPCLPRSLTTARLLGRMGIASEVKVGARRENGKVAGHAWVEQRGAPITDPGEPDRLFVAFPGPASQEEMLR